MAWYLYTSGLVKLVVPKPEPEALRGWLGSRPESLATSDLARTEFRRARPRWRRWRARPSTP